MPPVKEYEKLGLVGVSRVAEMLGVTPATFRKLRATKFFIEPFNTGPGTMPMWRINDVKAFIKKIRG